MNRKRLALVIILVIVAVILISVGVSYFTESQPTQITTTAGSLKCYDNPKYFAIDSEIGSVLVKYKTSADQNFSCAYTVDMGDFQTPTGSPDYFLGFASNFLVIDSGTSPEPHGLIIYDLNTQKEVFTDSYSSPIEIQDSAITYWGPTKTIPTKANCPQFDQLTADGLGMVIEQHVTLTLPGLVKTGDAQYQCAPTQG
jgi:hypothetical protein